MHACSGAGYMVPFYAAFVDMKFCQIPIFLHAPPPPDRGYRVDSETAKTHKYELDGIESNVKFLSFMQR